MTDRMDTEALRALAAINFNVRKDPDDAGGWFITAERACRADMVGPTEDRERMALAMAAGSTLAAEVLELRAKVQSLGTEGHAYREGKLAGARIARNAALEQAALIAEAEAERILSKQDGRIPEVDQNLRFMTLILPGVAETIRAKKEGG